MTAMLLNCDIGERGIGHETDLAIMRHIDVANIACGGHAGDAHSVRFFSDMARRLGVVAAAHLSYPDREHFGRASMRIGAAELCDALTAQLGAMAGATWLKFHGALYNDSCEAESLAAMLADWAAQRGIAHVLAPEDSAFAAAAGRRGLDVVAEVYAERRYTLDRHGRLCLVPRSKAYACLHDCGEALDQARRLIQHQTVDAVVAERSDGTPILEARPIRGRTLCVHSDSAISLPLVQELSALIRGAGTDKREPTCSGSSSEG